MQKFSLRGKNKIKTKNIALCLIFIFNQFQENGRNSQTVDLTTLK